MRLILKKETKCQVWKIKWEVDCGDEDEDYAPEVWLTRSGIIQGGSSRGRQTRFLLFYFFKIREAWT